jgi:hypothetical protein
VRQRERVIVPQSTVRTQTYLRHSEGLREIPPKRDAGSQPAPGYYGQPAELLASRGAPDYADISRPGSAVTSADVFDIGIIRRSA